MFVFSFCCGCVVKIYLCFKLCYLLSFWMYLEVCKVFKKFKMMLVLFCEILNIIKFMLKFFDKKFF